ncbi:carboxymuconolactone decarboxylase family protein [Rhodococcus maanshanensis]|uniref:Alkylhydroperoxidase AhpD family core domain-containing protein n=1 Tax=Rhodococcus maanshanensis TaxID=183556 RepID=A0A1H7YJR7_9NOCA|nr:carboxymuconolactone decarboxylase family protein [Rhodococcus maanshanensis]SEM46486.1 alkylhydroperoxidase AhpD family core domain-containing protein [Rhodococcus maanshanensis]
MPFTHHTAQTAPAAVRPTMVAIEGKFGFLPAPVALMSESPELLQAFTRSNTLFERGTLTELEREVLVLTIATRNECHVCVALHTASLTRAAAPEELVTALRARQPLPEPRLEAVRVFTLAVLDAAGGVSEAQMHAFLDHGFTRRNALEVVLGVGTYTLSTFANRMTDAPLDEAFAPFAWEGAA